jgi:hypothetical protein
MFARISLVIAVMFLASVANAGELRVRFEGDAPAVACVVAARAALPKEGTRPFVDVVAKPKPDAPSSAPSSVGIAAGAGAPLTLVYIQDGASRLSPDADVPIHTNERKVGVVLQGRCEGELATDPLCRARTRAFDKVTGSDRQECAQTIEHIVEVGSAAELKAGSAHGSLAMYCAEDPALTAKGGRAVFLELQTPGGSLPTLNVLSYASGFLVFGFDVKAKMPSYVTASVLGGDYAPGASVLAVADLANVKLAPRCREVHVPLPPIAPVPDTTQGGVQWGACLSSSATDPAGRPERSCRASFDWNKGLSFLTTLAGEELGLDVQVAPARTNWVQVAAPGEWQLYQVIIGADASIRVRARRLTFRWRRPSCLAKLESPRDCPLPKLKDGLSCRATALESLEQVCSYECPAGVETTFELPQSVEFTYANRDERWSDTLAFAGEQLDAGADSSLRELPVDLAGSWDKDWSDELDQAGLRAAGPAGDRIHYVEIIGPKGELHRIQPRRGQRVIIPSAGCGSVVSYRVVGTRQYETLPGTILAGRLSIANPKRAARQFRVGASLGGGSMMVTDGGHIRFRPEASASIAARYEPVLARGPALGLELSLIDAVAPQSYLTLPVNGDGSQHQTGDAGYNRTFLLFGFDLFPRDGLSLGGRAGLGAGWPIRGLDVPRVGGVRPLGRADFIVRVWFTHSIVLEPALWVFGPQPVRTFAYDAVGIPTQADHSTVVPGAELNVRLFSE